MAKTPIRKNQLSASERLVIKRALTHLKLWWATPPGIVAEDARLDALMDSVEQLINNYREGK